MVAYHFGIFAMSASSSLKPPAYRLHKPTGRAVVRLNGHDHYLGKHNTPESRAEYDRLIAEWLTSGRHPLREATLTVNELVLA